MATANEDPTATLGVEKVILDLAVREVFSQTCWTGGGVEKLPHLVADTVHLEHVSTFTSSAGEGLLASHAAIQVPHRQRSRSWSKNLWREMARLDQLLKDAVVRRHDHVMVGPLETGVFTCPSNQAFPKWSMVAEQISPGLEVVNGIQKRGSSTKLAPHPGEVISHELQPGCVCIQEAPGYHVMAGKKRAQISKSAGPEKLAW